MSDIQQNKAFIRMQTRINHALNVVDEVKDLPYPLEPTKLVEWFEAMGSLMEYSNHNRRYNIDGMIRNITQHGGVDEAEVATLLNTVLALFTDNLYVHPPIGIRPSGNLLIDWADNLLILNQYKGTTQHIRFVNMFNTMRFMWCMFLEETPTFAPHHRDLIKYYLLIDRQAITTFTNYLAIGNCNDLATIVHSAIDALLPIYKLQACSPGLDVVGSLDLHYLFRQMYIEINSAPDELYDSVTDQYQTKGFMDLVHSLNDVSLSDLQSCYFVDDNEVSRICMFYGCMVALAMWDYACESQPSNVAIRNPYVPVVSTSCNDHLSDMLTRLDEAVIEIKKVLPISS